MSDLLIKNLELPKEDRIQLSIYPNGKVINHSSFTDTTLLSIELPPHGRLIDADRLTQVMKGAILISNNGDLKDNLMKLVGECTIDYLKESLTVLEASKED